MVRYEGPTVHSEEATPHSDESVGSLRGGCASLKSSEEPAVR